MIQTSFKVSVSGLDPRLEEDDLIYFFEQIGDVKKVVFDEGFDEEGLRSATVTYQTPEEARNATEQCNNFSLMENLIRVHPYRSSNAGGVNYLPSMTSGSHSQSSVGNPLTSGDGCLDLDSVDGEGIRMDNATRLALMARLSHRTAPAPSPVDVNLPLSQGMSSLDEIWLFSSSSSL